MKTILWATLTANGNYAQSSAENPPKKEAFEDFVMQVKAAGNFITGRQSFQNMQAGKSRVADSEGENDGDAFADIDIVVISRSLGDIQGVQVVRSPQDALDYLQEKGHQKALLSGGAELHNGFLALGLVDELIFNIAPVLEGKGLNLLLDQENYEYKDVRLINSKPLGSGVVQLHYSVKD